MTPPRRTTAPFLIDGRLTFAGKTLIVLLSLWGLIVVMPDTLRIAHPLGTLGFSADNDGAVYRVDESGPAAKAGVRAGDRIALDVMSCARSSVECTQVLSVFGGMAGLQYVRAGSTVSLWLRGPPGTPASGTLRHVTVASVPESHGATETARTAWALALVADELGALAFIVCSAWLVWRRPCLMTAGFFAYAIWFNPGQYFEFYSWLQGRPPAMFAQETLQAVSQSFGYVGFVMLALHFPNDVSRPRLRWVHGALPWVFGVLTALQFASFLNAFGIGTEIVTRISYIAGWTVDAAVLLYVLPAILHDQPPEEKARTRWLLTGCVAGLSAFVFADFNEATTMSPFNLSETATNLLYFANVITLGVVVYTIRHHRVVNLGIALARGVERIGMLVLVTALGAYLIHRVDEQLGREMQWDEIAVSLALVGVTLAWERVQDAAIEMLDGVLFPRFRRALDEMQALAIRLRDVTSIAHVDRALIESTTDELQISSAAIFRRARSGAFRRGASVGWSPQTMRELHPAGLLLDEYTRAGTAPIRLHDTRWASGTIPSGVEEPMLAIPIHACGTLQAIVLYGAHASGDALNAEEIDVLASLAVAATIAYQSTEAAALRRRVTTLRRALPAR